MVSIPEIRERIAAVIKERLKNEAIVVSTEYQPVIEYENPDTIVVTVQPVSFSAIYADRQRYSVEPKIAVTVSKRITKRQKDGDSILVMGAKIIAACLGIGVGGAIVRTVEVSDPVLSEDTLSGQNIAASRLVFTLMGFESKGT